MINEKGMRMFGILMTNYLTWKRRGVSIRDVVEMPEGNLNPYQSLITNIIYYITL